MILPVNELLGRPEFSQENQESLTRKLEGLEQLIRAYTNNNFQLRAVRFWAVSSGNQLLGSSPYLAVGRPGRDHRFSGQRRALHRHRHGQ